MEEKYLELMAMIQNYSTMEKEQILKAYNLAKELHSHQVRESGEPYIIHPLSVAIILAEMQADSDTICAGLLHDTLEDTPITKEELTEIFNSTVANLVDGVTKISRLKFSSKQEQNAANTRKIILGLTEDVRIIIIKLADRLHNMRTLDFKNELKQKENALETLQIFVPLAYYIGAYRIKCELEDLSLKYLKPEMYQKVSLEKALVEKESNDCLEEMLRKVKAILADRNIPNEIRLRTKNIYGIYQRLEAGHTMHDIHDLLALKVMVKKIDECYQVLGLVHKEYHPINCKFKDYICNPKTNMYQSLHTTVFAPDERLVQTQIRTFDMDLVASFGLSAYWKIHNGDSRKRMQQDLKEKYQFFKSLLEINGIFGDNIEFVRQVKSELFADKVYVYTAKGDIIELPKGSTVIDFAYQIHTEIGNTMVGAIVNEENVGIDYVLKNKDRVRILTDALASGPDPAWENIAKTSYARKKIREFNRK